MIYLEFSRSLFASFTLLLLMHLRCLDRVWAYDLCLQRKRATARSSKWTMESYPIENDHSQRNEKNKPTTKTSPSTETEARTDETSAIYSLWKNEKKNKSPTNFNALNQTNVLPLDHPFQKAPYNLLLSHDSLKKKRKKQKPTERRPEVLPHWLLRPLRSLRTMLKPVHTPRIHERQRRDRVRAWTGNTNSFRRWNLAR